MSASQGNSQKPLAEGTNGDKAASQKPANQQLEEDDEFEDFPVEDWTEEETSLPGGNTHLWEESWDDDDTTEDFAVQLKAELNKSSKQG